MPERSDPATGTARTDLRAFAYEICDCGNELFRDEIAATLLAVADQLERIGSDAPYAFWLGRDAAP